MICEKCSKQNPAYAAFCAYCGAKLPGPQAADAKAKQDKPAAEAKRKPAVRHRPVDANRTVRPLDDNPAQPVRPGALRYQSATKSRTNPQAAAYKRPEPPKKPAEEAAEAPVDELIDALVEPVAEPKEEPESAFKNDVVSPPPAEEPRSAPRPGKALNARGEEIDVAHKKVPARATHVVHGARKNTLVPERVRMKRRPAGPVVEDDSEYEETFAQRAVSIAAGVFLLIAFCVAFWLIATSSGQVFRARMGLGAPAGAYKLLGDQMTESGQVSKAAEAYHDALTQDPSNYQYALLTAQAMEADKQYDNAVRAYQMAINLNAKAPDPYRMLANLYQRLDKPEQRQNALAAGYLATGDESLNPDGQG